MYFKNWLSYYSFKLPNTYIHDMLLFSSFLSSIDRFFSSSSRFLVIVVIFFLASCRGYNFLVEKSGHDDLTS